SKGIEYWTNGYPGFYFEEPFGSAAMMVQAQVVREVNWDSENFSQNIGNPLAFENGRWYCIEGYVKVEHSRTCRRSDSHVDRRHVAMEYIGRQFRGPSPTDPGPSTAQFSYIMFSGSKNPQPTDQYTWYDDIVLATQRIGCSG